MPRIIEFEGRRIEVPDDFGDEDIAEVLSAQPATPAQQPAVATAAQEPGWLDTLSSVAGYADDTGAIMLDSARGGMADLLGLPVDLVNSGLGLVGLGSERPFLGSDMIEDIIGAPATAVRSVTGMEEPQPQDAFQRVADRVGREVGATAVPLLGALGAAARTGVEGSRNLGPLARYFVEPAAVAPGRLIAKETQYAVGSGLGAGIANEAAGNPQEGDNFWSDFLGSLAGVGLTGLADTAAGASRNALAATFGKPGMMDDVAGEEVVNRIINNSTDAGRQMAETGRVDTAPLARRIRTPSPVEEAVPGYVANIGDRAQDPLLQTLVQNQDMLNPGAATARRIGNDAAVTRRIGELAPDGDPAMFRAAVEAGRDAQIAEALDAEDIARIIYGEAEQAVQPGMRDATARGSSLRAGLQDAQNAVKAQVDEAWRPINEATNEVPVGPLADRFGAVTENLPMNDRARFMPSEASIPNRLMPLDAEGAPDPTATVPLREITSLRGGLTDDIRANRANRQNNAARVGDQYRSQIDEYLEENIPADLADQYAQARAARRDLADRFERPGTGIAETLRPREGGGYSLDDSAVAQRFAQPDQGNVNDFRALLREAGGDARVRGALADEVLSDVQTRGLIARPEQLNAYLDQRRILLGEFPELKQKLQRAGVASEYLRDVTKASETMQKRLTTPGRSAQASYLKYGDEATVDAVRGLVSGPRPREAARELLEAAGGTPEARANARAALWEVVKTKTFKAPNAAGADRWDAKKLKSMFDDPKTAAVAEELWADNPEDLAAIKEVFSALAGAEGSVRTRAANSSGTAQALAGKFDPALSTTSIASRARSVSRGVLSPGIAVVDVVSTWMRNRTKQVQARAIDQLAAEAFNNPGLAADLLEAFNPADYAAKRRMITQKYGVRATQTLNLLDEAMNEDPVMEAVSGE